MNDIPEKALRTLEERFGDRFVRHAAGEAGAEESFASKLVVGWFSFTCCEDSTILFTELLNDHLDEWKRVVEFRHLRVLKTRNTLSDHNFRSEAPVRKTAASGQYRPEPGDHHRCSAIPVSQSH
jgi:hypothetical protein